MVKPELHEYLEGTRPAAELSEPSRAEAEAWDRLVGAVRADERPTPWLEGRVMHAVTARAARPAWRRRLGNLIAEPRRLLLGVGLAAAAVLALLLVRPGGSRSAPVLAPAAFPDQPVLVQFAFDAPGASSVVLTGSFNGWSLHQTLLSDPDGDGLWTAMVPLAPGLHQYMFVVDEVEWVTDPRAERYVQDGFGRDNAVVAVGGPQRAL